MEIIAPGFALLLAAALSTPPQQPDIAILAHVRAKELRFEIVPNVTAESAARAYASRSHRCR